MLLGDILKLGISENKGENYGFDDFIGKKFGGLKIKWYIWGGKGMLGVWGIKLLMVWEDI